MKGITVIFNWMFGGRGGWRPFDNFRDVLHERINLCVAPKIQTYHVIRIESFERLHSMPKTHLFLNLVSYCRFCSIWHLSHHIIKQLFRIIVEQHLEQHG